MTDQDVGSKPNPLTMSSEMKAAAQVVGGALGSFPDKPYVPISVSGKCQKDEDVKEAVRSVQGATGTYIEALENSELIQDIAERPRPSETLDCLFVPLAVERVILYGMLVCLESLLFTLTILPVRALFHLLQCCFSLLTFSKPSLTFQQQAIVFKGLFIFLAWAIVSRVDVSTLVQLVRHSEMKLKMIWLCLEFLDILFKRYGQTMLGSFFWSLVVPNSKLRWSRFAHFIGAVGYMVLHTMMLMVHMAVLDIAVNSGNTSLLSLVILVQFTEVKAAATKKWKRQQLFEMCADDIVERFSLAVYVAMLFLINLTKEHQLGEFSVEWSDDFVPLVILYLSEVFVDWTKHISICNNNAYTPGFYVGKLQLLCQKQLVGLRTSPFHHDHSASTSRHLGLWPLPLTVVVLRVMFPWLFSLRWKITVPMLPLFVWLPLLVLKFANVQLLKIFSTFYPMKYVDGWFDWSDIEPIEEPETKKQD
ncbi:transmembrane anterior posterior transformation protein 1 [Pelomyxa schiedti]|nr:transmembrane anterior posterior transformation protein 1 [Pelomyxa schiedti]